MSTLLTFKLLLEKSILNQFTDIYLYAIANHWLQCPESGPQISSALG